MSQPLQQLPKLMHQSLNIVVELSPYQPILLTRHSIRVTSDGQGIAGYDLPLTPEGRLLATAWGKHLGEHLGHVHVAASSPVGRCVETAYLMLQNQNSSSIPTVSREHLLVEPGSFVLDIQDAAPQFKTLGALAFINAILAQSLMGLKHPKQGVYDILHLLYNMQVHPRSGLHLAVSHDTILSVVLAVLMGKQQITWDDWPEMMEGLFLWFDGAHFEESTLHWVWRGVYYCGSIQNLKI